MKKLFKGCLISILIIFGLIISTIIGGYIYLQSPNKIKLNESPISKSKYIDLLSFPNTELPEYVFNTKNEDIIYQALLEEDGFDKTVIFKTVISLKSKLDTKNFQKYKTKDKTDINRYISFNSFENFSFKPIIKTPENGKTESGKHISIYSKRNNIELDLNNSRYKTFYNSIDKNGTISEITIYDNVNNLIYFERKRYYAFQ